MIYYLEDDDSIRELVIYTLTHSNLEAKGFVRRFRSEEDERVLFVELTEKGRQLKEEGIRIHGEMVKHLPLTMDESKQLYDLLNKVLDGMKE